VFERFERLRNYLNESFEAYIEEWFPNVRKVNCSTWRTGDFNDTRSNDGSLTFSLRDKYAIDFSTGEKAGDIIAIYAKRFCDGNNGRAFNELVERYHLENLFSYHINSNNSRNGIGSYRVSGDSNSHSNDSVKEIGGESIGKTNEERTNVDNGQSPIRSRLTKEDFAKDEKIRNILSRVRDYQKGDPVDLYLRSRGITKYSPDTKILNLEKMSILVNLCRDWRSKNSGSTNGNSTSDSFRVVGIQEIFLTKDGRKRKNNDFPGKIQRTFTNETIAGHPLVLRPKGNNNGHIYVTEGVENGLSLQEHLNNEVWCSLSIANIPTLPFDNDRVYIIVFDNDFGKRKEKDYSKSFQQKLDELEVKYEINPRDSKIHYDEGELHLRDKILKLSKLNNKHIFYLLSSENGKDANDLLNEKVETIGGDGIRQISTKLQQLLSQPPIPITTCRTVRTNRGEIRQGWRPPKPPSLVDEDFHGDDKINSFLNLPYDSEGLALRFIARYGSVYRFVRNVGVCKYNGGRYEKECDNALFEDLRKTLAKTYYEFDYLTDREQLSSFKKLWKTKGIGEHSTIVAVEKYVKRMLALEAKVEDFDSEDDNVLNLNNGYYDLDRQELIAHSPDKLFFKKIGVDHCPDKTPDRVPDNDWTRFLNSSLGGDQDKIRYLQKSMGYTFSTSTREEKIFFVKGITRSGKSLFLDTVGEVMGEYSESEDKDFLTAKDQNSNYLLDSRAQLKGKRFLHISELTHNSKVNSTLIKRLAGDKYITGAEKFKGKIRYKNQVKYWISTNNLDFDNFDESVRTKLVIIDFGNRFYKAGTKEALETGRVIDENLKKKLIQPHNKRIILQWIIEGYRLYREEGLKSTQGMEENLDQIEQDNDSLKSFIDDNMKKYDETTQIVKNPKDIGQIYQLYSKYEQEEYGTPPERIITLRKFFKVLRNRGFSLRRGYTTGGDRKYYIVGWLLNWEVVENRYNN
jgi:P4 family phage/plasmid primase-like protien